MDFTRRDGVSLGDFVLNCKTSQPMEAESHAVTWMVSSIMIEVMAVALLQDAVCEVAQAWPTLSDRPSADWVVESLLFATN
jgi:hypothetical protein